MMTDFTSCIDWEASELVFPLTCGDEEDSGAEENVVCLVVDAAHANAQPTEHQQAGAKDGEHAGGTDDTYKTRLVPF